MKYVLIYPLGNILYLISYWTPKSNKIWVFGSWGGKQYADNPKYLYNYIYENETDIKAVWLSVNKQLVYKLRDAGKHAYYTYSLLGFWYSCRAKIGIISHGMIDLNRYACARMNIVQTWHGIPMKPILLSDPKPDSIKKRIFLKKLSWLFPFLKKDLNFESSLIICSSSSYVTKILNKVFGKNAPLKVTGFPRLDGLFTFNTEIQIAREIKKYQDLGIQVGIYMPTYRREGEVDVIDVLKNHIHQINEFLKHKNQILYLKMHPFDFYRIQDDFSFERVKLLKNEEIDGDIYTILGLFDYLISDYSSIVFDFLIKSKPVYLLTPDREEYIESNGKFVFDYLDLDLPNYTNWDQLLPALVKPNLNDTRELKSISNKIHKHKDGKSSKRLFHRIVKEMSS